VFRDAALGARADVRKPADAWRDLLVHEGGCLLQGDKYALREGGPPLDAASSFHCAFGGLMRARHWKRKSGLDEAASFSD
jgi:hypothetical protein